MAALEILFLSDLHLSPVSPGVTRLFLDFLRTRARRATQVFILGDLFEAWPGDDCIDDPGEAFSKAIVDAIAGVTAAGVPVAVMHGNRDFLLGEAFASRSGATLLPDPYLLTSADWQFVLAHGDALCTEDAAYQAFRAQVRSPAWRNEFLAKPLTERKAIAAALRQQSEASKRDKAQYLMDLSPVETDDFLRQHGYVTFIHGHTHRPAVHSHLVDGISVERWVLSDWHDDRGEYLVWNGDTLIRESIESEKNR